VGRRKFVVTADWDEEARVWVAESGDVPGLVTQAASADELIAKLQKLVPELLGVGGQLRKGRTGQLEIVTQFRAHTEIPV
jgi:predicted RNase H-like HicB family nuclease